MVLSAVGGVDHSQLLKLAERHFGDLTSDYSGMTPNVKGIRFTGSEVVSDFCAYVRRLIENCCLCVFTFTLMKNITVQSAPFFSYVHPGQDLTGLNQIGSGEI